jgi:hypothetical protein
MIFLSILQDILVMKPFLTWYRSVIVSGIIKDSVKHVYINLRKKATSIILRSRAESHVHQKSFNTRIQHVSIYKTTYVFKRVELDSFTDYHSYITTTAVYFLML